MKLCCIFNYPPLYRQSIFCKIDQNFDTQFIWAEELQKGVPCDIKRIDYKLFRRVPIINENKLLFGRLGWVTKIQLLPFKKYSTFLITGIGSFSILSFLIISKLFGKKVYGWGHGHKNFSGLLGLYNKTIYKLLSGFFTYGDRGKERLVSLGIPEKKIHVIYNSIGGRFNTGDRNSCESDVLKKHFGNNYPTLLFIGRLTRVKQLDWLIKAKYNHDRDGIHYNLLLIGDGAEGEELQKLIQKLDNPNEVWLYGDCYDENILNSLIYNADLCVSPGNVGLTALHSMMYGTPVLSHDDFEMQMPEYETIVPGKTGILYKRGSFEDFCNKIKDWLIEPKNRLEIRQNCFEMINGKWNSDYQLEIFKKVFYG